MTNLETAQKHWADALAQLKITMTHATYEFSLRGSQVIAVQEDSAYQIGAPPAAVEWLANRLKGQVERSLAIVAGQKISLEFIPLPSTLPPLSETIEAPPGEPGPSDAGLAMASINYYIAYFEPKKSGGMGTGFDLVPHPYVYFWQALLGPAFDLWLLLMADDRSALTKNPATWWTQPKLYSFEKLTHRLNRKHLRYVAGGELECTRSRDWRKEGRPLQHPEGCCGGPGYAQLRFKKHPRSGLICSHWSVGLLEVLARWELVVVEINEGYKCKIQTWRMLPHLTPYQVDFFHPAIKEEWESFFREYGANLNPPLSFPFWQTTVEENIVPLLPIHDQPEITHNFDERRPYQEFLKHAIANPHYVVAGEAEGEDDE